jgi:hypothetical protein
LCSFPGADGTTQTTAASGSFTETDYTHTIVFKDLQQHVGFQINIGRYSAGPHTEANLKSDFPDMQVKSIDTIVIASSTRALHFIDYVPDFGSDCATSGSSTAATCSNSPAFPTLTLGSRRSSPASASSNYRPPIAQLSPAFPNKLQNP